jgi:hypothetical protein
MGSSKKVRGKPAIAGKKPLAICKVSAGYGTDSYNPDTHERTHAMYCHITEIVLNEDYWYVMFNCGGFADSEDEIAAYFDLPWAFGSYIVTAYADGSRDYKEITK